MGVGLSWHQRRCLQYVVGHLREEFYSEWKGLKLTGRAELFLEEKETKRGNEEKRAGGKRGFEAVL